MAKALTEVHRAVLEKLVGRRIWGTYHVSIVTLLRFGWKSHERGTVKQAVKDLINMKLIKWYHKGNKAIQLDKSQLTRVKELLG